jgi:hypothetical protein
MLLFLGLQASVWCAEFALSTHNDFMRKYRKAQAEGRL